MADPEKALDHLHQYVKSDPEMSMPVAVVKALTETIKSSQASTMSELMMNLKTCGDALKERGPSAVAATAGYDLLSRHISNTDNDTTIQTFKEHIIKKAEFLASNARTVRENVAKEGSNFVRDGSTILVHSYSRVVMQLLIFAAKANKQFNVFVTESRPLSRGKEAVAKLREHGIPAKLILDAAVGYFIERVNMVLVGAEGVVENGGLINQIGTYQIAVVAKAANKPFYVVTESYKFVRLFPLNQYDLPGHTVALRFGHVADDEMTKDTELAVSYRLFGGSLALANAPVPGEHLDAMRTCSRLESRGLTRECPWPTRLHRVLTLLASHARVTPRLTILLRTTSRSCLRTLAC
ncbi:initiation factor 2 subunit family-domain-containing protein [Polychytrium aggregatum]|uniref:initiation factor 2 subunit family-domain-containing protein n=1 Tax=Polychytrium aggregatum TaxID=110093 RepID=UPI0022FDB410|nr:initiation factor 2 subunit family-domain-containing protein [Polychytrium aggregatum]KAI9203424.1 initiation factor 2 subunit family-domain-containing protein [Polychytrium aggregatum]